MEDAGLGHLSTASSSGNSSIFVMEGELPRLAEGDGVDDDVNRACRRALAAGFGGPNKT